MSSRTCTALWCASMLALCLLSIAGPVRAHADADGAAVATVAVDGVDDPASRPPHAEPWVPAVAVPLREGDTAWDLICRELEAAGCPYEASESTYGVFVQSITSPDGVTLENTSSEPYSFWAFLVNGEMPNEGVSSCTVQRGDEVRLVYYAGGEAPLYAGVTADATEVAAGDGGSQETEGDPEASNTEADHGAYIASRLAVAGIGGLCVVIAVAYVARARRARR